jgi:hypothetical protein
MNIKLHTLILVATLLIMVVSCNTEKVALQPEYPEGSTIANPGTNYALKGPEWKWNSSNKSYTYIAPEYVMRENGVWVRGHWKQVKGGYSWIPGYWKE